MVRLYLSKGVSGLAHSVEAQKNTASTLSSPFLSSSSSNPSLRPDSGLDQITKYFPPAAAVSLVNRQALLHFCNHMAEATSRRLQAFQQWMASNSVECVESLELVDSVDRGIFVRSKCNLEAGRVVATIPKAACLTIKTSAGCSLIEAADLGESLGLAVAIMYERSLGINSAWSGYLQVLPECEPLPFTWSLDEVDSLLMGTELHKTMKEDKDLIYSDWNECIKPFIDSLPPEIDRSLFGVEQYFAAKSLVASRSFEIDEYYGSGMVPVADLFNHKTGAEHVHFTATPSDESDDDDDDDGSNDGENDDGDSVEDDDIDDGDNEEAVNGHEETENSDLDDGDDNEETNENPLVLEMILVKDVIAGEEVFNTYGLVGNAALLHRYGFTEPDNLYDIVNIDLDLVSEWSSSVLSDRHYRARLALWRSISETPEYFEISYNGEPEFELIFLLYIITLPDAAFDKLNVVVSDAADGEVDSIRASVFSLLKNGRILDGKGSEVADVDVLLTGDVCKALISLADIRDSLYGKRSLDDEEKLLGSTCSFKERNLYHSLTLRVCERRILRRLETYAKDRVSSQLSHKRKKLNPC